MAVRSRWFIRGFVFHVTLKIAAFWFAISLCRGSVIGGDPGVPASRGSGPLSKSEILKAFRYFKKSTRSLPTPMVDNIPMDIITQIDARRAALAACPSPQLHKLSDLNAQWWTPLSCHMGRHIQKVFYPDVQRSNNSQRWALTQALNRSTNSATSKGKELGDSVSRFMGYKDFEHWNMNWEDNAYMPCLPPVENVNLRYDSRESQLRNLAMFWHGNLQSYFLFFTMVATHQGTTPRFTETAREFSCRLFEVLDMIRNILVQLEMKPRFKHVPPPDSDCMNTSCQYSVDPFHRIAVGVRDSLELLQDIRRRVDDFRTFFDDSSTNATPASSPAVTGNSTNTSSTSTAVDDDDESSGSPTGVRTSEKLVQGQNGI